MMLLVSGFRCGPAWPICGATSGASTRCSTEHPGAGPSDPYNIIINTNNNNK